MKVTTSLEHSILFEKLSPLINEIRIILEEAGYDTTKEIEFHFSKKLWKDLNSCYLNKVKIGDWNPFKTWWAMKIKTINRSKK